MTFPINTLQVALKIFVVCLILFHLPLVFVKLKRKDGQPVNHSLWKKGWECTDYFWFSVTIITLITASYEVTRMYSESELRSLLPRAETITTMGHDIDVKHAESFLGSVIRSSHPQKAEAIAWFEDGLKAIKKSDPLLQEAKALFRDGKPIDSEGKEALEKLKQARSYNHEFLDKHKTIEETIREAYDAKILRRKIEERDQLAEAMVNAYQRTQKGQGEKELLFMLPTLLAVGFATRFAKVSARVFVDV